MANKKLKDFEKGMKRLTQLKRDISRSIDRKVESGVRTARKEYLKYSDKILGAPLDYVEPKEDYNAKIVSYSTFNIEVLGKYLAEIISLYEGKDYCYQKAPLFIPGVSNDCEVYLIVDEEYKCDFYEDYDRIYSINTLERVSKNGVVLSTYLSTLDFYRIDENANLVSTIDFERFPYIKKFIDYIVDYRIKNNLETLLSDEQLRELEMFYVYDNVSEICDRFKIREKEAIVYLMDAKENNERVGRRIDKILKL